MSIVRRDKSKKRNSILDAAIKVFRTHGYEHSSMDTIAEVANASKRTVYNHFPSKDELFHAVMGRFLDEVSQSKQFHYAPDTPLEEQLLHIADTKAAISENESWLATMKVSMTVMTSHPELALQTVKHLETLDDYLGNWLRAAVSDGKLKIDDIDLAKEVFESMFAGAFYFPCVMHGPVDPVKATKLKREFVRLFLNTYQS